MKPLLRSRRAAENAVSTAEALVQAAAISADIAMEAGLKRAKWTQRRLFALSPAGRRLRLLRAEVRAIQPGNGVVVSVSGSPVAIHRDSAGSLSAVTGVCSHDGSCAVLFDRERSGWQCPRHGARFGLNGEVKRGPAKTPLLPVDVAKLDRRRTQPANESFQPRRRDAQ